MKKLKDIIVANPRATDSELIVLYYESLDYKFGKDLRRAMTTGVTKITHIERKFRDYNHLRTKVKEEIQRKLL